MSQVRKNFIFKNEDFVCENCAEENPAGEGFVRNHCRKCLFSKHVDKDIPGDRANECQGLMKPFFVYKHSKKGWMIEFKCEFCSAVSVNMVVPDDDFERIIELTVVKDA